MKGIDRVISRFREAHRQKALLRSSLVGIAALALSAGIVCGPTMTAAADPALTIAEAKTQIEQLETEAAAIDQDYAGVKEQIDTGTAKLQTKQADVKTQTARVAKIRREVGQVALAQFQNRSLDTTAQLFFNSDTDGFLSQISTVEKVSENQNTVLQSFQAEQATLAGLQRSAEADLALLTEQRTELTELRASSDKKLAESKAVLAKLTDEERQRLAAEEKARADAAAKVVADAEKARAEAASRSGDREAPATKASGSNASTKTPGTTAKSTAGRGAAAMAFAKNQVGKQYRFGAIGPDAYDCSGLTGAAWKAAGVTLPRTSQQQIGVGRAVSRADLQPGDLVFFYADISHVGLYAGDGVVLQSARPGKPVGYAKVDDMPFAGARRPG